MDDQIALILTALSKGGLSGLQNSASSAVSSAIQNLRTLTKKRLASRKDGDIVLAQYESNPDMWEEALASQLKKAGAERDSDLLAAATMLMRILADVSPKMVNTAVNIQTAQAVQVGNHNTQKIKSKSPKVSRTGIRAVNCTDGHIDGNKIKNADTGIDIEGGNMIRVRDNEIS